MAKSSRASKIKTNNSKLKNRVFAPVETARTERLSAKLLELASQPWPAKKDSGDVAMDTDGAPEENVTEARPKDVDQADHMEIDQSSIKPNIKSKTGRSRIEKKKGSRSKASIVFPRYKLKGKKK